ncbi:lytic murein transglycosylase [Alkalilimnicola sp. S0819]|uniref:lytic murein transglycosylase n=1 Tax=Alkalilimnicola sp. S0819 TaxID=2613922 RepID=UPI0012617F45|nr:lytic murein transglycosylase [Alkalilimnicola sp. S0819]KAB7627669.1 lytic murein transglycosylase [Alkalilimnicola sp. S0819]MPQ15836.1 lytic murein transglycosylase [Alkalilimnicola sp. S0819]
MRLTALLLALPLISGAALAEEDSFRACLDELRAQALAQGLSDHAVDRAFAGIQRRPRVLELDASQPEFQRTFWQYLQARVTQARVEQGRRLLQAHGPLLWRVHREFGVRPEYLLAFWGLETNYGGYMGGMGVLDALATLACDTRRADFFRNELLQALRIVQSGDVALELMRGSWAGAMGHKQFMPSTYNAYALDYDGDGRRDLWGSLPDAFASAANYLSAEGWRDGERWGREVRLPRDFDWSLARLDENRPLDEWRALGVRRANGAPLPPGDMQAALLLPQGHRGPSFLVYQNFHVIMRWNRSSHYALAVGHLADRIAGMGELRAAPLNEAPLRRGQVLEIQRGLNALGLGAGEPDGIVGPQTRQAVRAFQQIGGYPADGHADQSLLRRLRESLEQGPDPAGGST